MLHTILCGLSKLPVQKLSESWQLLLFSADDEAKEILKNKEVVKDEM